MSIGPWLKDKAWSNHTLLGLNKSLMWRKTVVIAHLRTSTKNAIIPTTCQRKLGGCICCHISKRHDAPKRVDTHDRAPVKHRWVVRKRITIIQETYFVASTIDKILCYYAVVRLQHAGMNTDTEEYSSKHNITKGVSANREQTVHAGMKTAKCVKLSSNHFFLRKVMQAPYLLASILGRKACVTATAPRQFTCNWAFLQTLILSLSDRKYRTTKESRKAT